ncbi:MAG: hypothetical protein WBA18_22635 [Terracidiphilus sp.]
MYPCFPKSVFRSLALVCAIMIPAGLFAQAGPSGQGTTNSSPSRWDIFIGYSYLAPSGTVATLNGNGVPVTASYDSIKLGGVGSYAYFFNRHVGLQGEVGVHEFGTQIGKLPSPIGTEGNDDGFTTFTGGIISRFPVGIISPFVHGLVGGAVVGGPEFEPNKLGVDLTAGGGMDIETPFFNRHLAIRLFQADYQYMHVNWGNGIYAGTANINSLRASAGLVFQGGEIAPPPPITLACSANPETIFPGDPVTVTASAGELNPKYNVIYGWSGTGVIGSGTTATVSTASLAPGEYNIQGTVKEGKPGKEGQKPWENATCTAGLTVKAFEPPTISCTVSPSTIKPGDMATVSCVGVSPQNRPLTYSYSASAGTVTGTGPTAEYSSAGAPTGVVVITGNVSDDKGHSANSPVNLTITAPYVPPAPKTQALCTISFAGDKRRPMRVDNEAKACLDQVALDLKQQADAKAVLVGESNAVENAKTAKEQAYAAKHKRATVDEFAAQRAVNAKDYLVTEQGIDASRISVATGTTDGQTVENYLVPAGATFSNDVSGTTPVDESTVKPQARKPLPERHSAH